MRHSVFGARQRGLLDPTLDNEDPKIRSRLPFPYRLHRGGHLGLGLVRDILDVAFPELCPGSSRQLNFSLGSREFSTGEHQQRRGGIAPCRPSHPALR